MKGGAPNEAFEEQLGTEITRRMWFMGTRVRKRFPRNNFNKEKKKRLPLLPCSSPLVSPC